MSDSCVRSGPCVASELENSSDRRQCPCWPLASQACFPARCLPFLSRSLGATSLCGAWVRVRPRGLGVRWVFAAFGSCETFSSVTLGSASPAGPPTCGLLSRSPPGPAVVTVRGLRGGGFLSLHLSLLFSRPSSRPLCAHRHVYVHELSLLQCDPAASCTCLRAQHPRDPSKASGLLPVLPSAPPKVLVRVCPLVLHASASPQVTRMGIVRSHLNADTEGPAGGSALGWASRCGAPGSQHPGVQDADESRLFCAPVRTGPGHRRAGSRVEANAGAPPGQDPHSSASTTAAPAPAPTGVGVSRGLPPLRHRLSLSTPCRPQPHPTGPGPGNDQASGSLRRRRARLQFLAANPR